MSDQYSNLPNIPKTLNNKVVDTSSSLLGYVQKLPEYSCKNHTKVEKALTRPSNSPPSGAGRS